MCEGGVKLTTLTKKRTISILVVLLIILNIYQFIKLSTYGKFTDMQDFEFKKRLTELSLSIEWVEGKKHSEIVDMASLASATGQSYATYISTSFYKDNLILCDALKILNENITNTNNIEEIIAKNDLTLLIPSIEKLKQNPLDIKTTEEFHYLIRKHTVIDSVLK